MSLNENRVYLLIVLRHILLRYLEELSFRPLHKLVNINGIVKGIRLNHRGKLYELPCKELLLKNVCMVNDTR